VLFLSIIFGLLLFKIGIDKRVLAMLVLFDYYFLLGLIDDHMKSIQKVPGIKSLTKLFHQILAAFLSIYLLDPLPAITVPFYGLVEMNQIVFDTLCIFGIVAASNAFNLTDGLDGLATICAIPVIIFMIYFSSEFLQLQIILAGILGGLIGFLYFNKFPAKIFMGDCGSLPIGGLLGLISIISDLTIFLLISGFVFFIEVLSVFIQIISVRFFGKRVFLLAPLHHHFEKKGMSEKIIVVMFGTMSFVFTLVAFYIKLNCHAI
jgi:phospho-N-acetylmuramoyl-pentapeptide-transferase